jgi:hypothetical protein
MPGKIIVLGECVKSLYLQKRPHAHRERMQRGDETDTDSNAYLVIELQLVKVSQDGHISRIVHVLLRDTLDI